MNKLALFSIFSLLCVSQSWSQTLNSSAPSIFYFESADLDFTKYSALHENVKADGHFYIETACIPAHVLCVKALDNQSVAGAFKQLALLSGINQIVERPNCTSADFDQLCIDARTGN